MKRNIRYVKRITLPLTRECDNDCVYCGFRKKDAPLLTLKQAEAVFYLAHKQDCSEVRIMAGCNPHHKKSIEKALNRFNVDTIVKYAFIVSNMAVNYGFLPVVELGLLSYDELKLLKKTVVAVNLFFECSKEEIFKSYAKRDAYLQMVKDAGELKIPLNIGLVVGLGESQEERFELIDAISETYKKYKHIQEFALQGYILNERTRLPMQRFLTIKELVELYKHIVRKLPEVTIQIQPNTMDFWQEIVSLGAGSIGSLSEDIDYVVPRYKKEDLSAVNKSLKKLRCTLHEELPLTPGFYKKQMFHEDMEDVLDEWVQKKAFRDYEK